MEDDDKQPSDSEVIAQCCPQNRCPDCFAPLMGSTLACGCRMEVKDSYGGRCLNRTRSVKCYENQIRHLQELSQGLQRKNDAMVRATQDLVKSVRGEDPKFPPF